MGALTGFVHRLGPGVYRHGPYLVERQENLTECTHSLCDTLHERFHTHTRDGQGAIHWVTYDYWVIWDERRDDYATGSDHFDTKRDAVDWLERHHDDCPRPQ